MFRRLFKKTIAPSSPSFSSSVIIPEYPHPDDLKNFSETTYADHDEEDIRTFLNRLSCAPETAPILNLLIQYGAIPDGIFLTNLVAFEFSLDMIRQVNDKRLMSHGYDYGHRIVADYIFFAAFHRDPNVLNFFIDRYSKDELNITLKNLNMMKELDTEERKLSVLDKERLFSSESCQEALNKFLKSAKYVPLNQKAVLDCLMSTIADANTPEEWQKIYRDHIDEPYLNPKNSNYFFNIFKKSYSKIKKIFIEHIQRNISEYFMNIEVLTTFSNENNIVDYHAICRDMLQSEVFSIAHENYGVNPTFRRNLNRCFEKIDKAFAKKLPLCHRLHRG
jgi:hypothetical protein